MAKDVTNTLGKPQPHLLGVGVKIVLVKFSGTMRLGIFTKKP